VGHKDRKGEYRAPDTSAASYETVEIGEEPFRFDDIEPCPTGNSCHAPAPLAYCSAYFMTPIAWLRLTAVCVSMRALPLLAPGRAAEYAAASGSNIDMDNYQPVEAGGNQSWAPNPLYTGGGKYRASLGAFYWRNGVVCLAGGAFACR